MKENRRPPAPRPGPRHHPLLDRLAEWHPQLFGDPPRPLKRGIYEDLVAAHPGEIDAAELKLALGLHTRSSRYLNTVAAGQPRHDLTGTVVEPMAPEHVYQALTEVFRRRQSRPQAPGRPKEDLRAKLVRRVAEAFDASGLSREDYQTRTLGRDEALNAVLTEALEQAGLRRARADALLRAFESGGQSIEDFAEAYGLDAREAGRMIEQAQARRAA